MELMRLMILNQDKDELETILVVESARVELIEYRISIKLKWHDFSVIFFNVAITLI